MLQHAVPAGGFGQALAVAMGVRGSAATNAAGARRRRRGGDRDRLRTPRPAAGSTIRGHPDADADGYVTMLYVDIVAEIDLITASRAYEAR